MKNKLAILGITFLFCVSAVSIVAQNKKKQVYKGCAKSKNFNRFVFTFAPIDRKVKAKPGYPNNPARVIPGADIPLKIGVGRTKFEEEKGKQSTNPTMGAVNENPNYEEPLSLVEPPKDNWLAKVTPATTLTTSLYLRPNKRFRRSAKRLRLDGNRNPVLETKGWKDGFYWVTLGNYATFKRPKRRTCFTTTPPVLIEVRAIKKTPPTATISRREGTCYDPTVTITVAAKQKDNSDTSRAPKRKLNLEWKILNSYREDVTWLFDITPTKGSPMDVKYTETAVSKIRLPNDKYVVRTVVSDGVFNVPVEETSFKSHCIP